jgi:hypothetical protein
MARAAQGRAASRQRCAACPVSVQRGTVLRRKPLWALDDLLEMIARTKDNAWSGL